MSIAAHRFNNDLRYRDDSHEMQRQLTPGYVLEPVREALGGIELDPCTEPNNPTRADRFYTAATDGATEPWDAIRIYVNPPYSKARERWVGRCVDAAECGASVILLVPSHTDTRLFQRAVQSASHVVFIKGRVKFGILRENRRQEAASHPSCLIAWNIANVAPLAHLGAVWDLTRTPTAAHVAAPESPLAAAIARLDAPDVRTIRDAARIAHLEAALAAAEARLRAGTTVTEWAVQTLLATGDLHTGHPWATEAEAEESACRLVALNGANCWLVSRRRTKYLAAVTEWTATPPQPAP